MKGFVLTKDKLAEGILDGLFPPRCPICGEVPKEEKALACGECIKGLSYIHEPMCMVCGMPVKREFVLCSNCMEQTHIFERNLSVWEYTTPMKRSLYGFKYNNKREYARFYGKEAVRLYGPLLEAWGVEAVIPIPLHKSRQRARGYNQAVCFGKEVAKGIGLPFRKDLLFRKKETIPQKALSLGERSRNLHHAFYIKEKVIPYKRVVLVDDIYTTGSTLDQASIPLKERGVEEVFALTIARASGS